MYYFVCGSCSFVPSQTGESRSGLTERLLNRRDLVLVCWQQGRLLILVSSVPSWESHRDRRQDRCETTKCRCVVSSGVPLTGREKWRVEEGVEGWRDEGVRREKERERGEEREHTTELAGRQKEAQNTKSGSKKREKLWKGIWESAAALQHGGKETSEREDLKNS